MRAMTVWLKTRFDEARLAFMLLTRLPVGRIHRDLPLASCMWAYPLVGVVIGTITGGIYGAALVLGLPPLAAAVLAIAAGILATGAMHEDGIADCMDGFGGGRTIERKLEIMHDSRLGSYGVLAMVTTLLLKVALLAAIANPSEAVATMIVAATASRAVLPVVMFAMPPARQSDLGGRASQDATATRVVFAALCGVVAIVAYGDAALLVLAGLTVAAAVMAALAWHQLRGITGDVLGMTQVVCELAVLCVLVAANMPP